MQETDREQEERILEQRREREEEDRQLKAAQEQEMLPLWESTLGPEITPMLDVHTRVWRQRPDQLLVTRMEFGGHWIEFGSPAEDAHTSPKSVIDRCRELFEQSTQEERDAYLDREKPDWLNQALTDAYIDHDGRLAYHSDTGEANPDD